jgi:hypothetical protein
VTLVLNAGGILAALSLLYQVEFGRELAKSEVSTVQPGRYNNTNSDLKKHSAFLKFDN